MRLIYILLFIVFFGKVATSFASSSYGAPIKFSGEGWEYSYGIYFDNTPFPGFVTCSTPQCYFGVFPRTGLGPAGTLCDSGGICYISPDSEARLAVVSVNRGTSMQDAYSKFCAIKGCFGNGATEKYANPDNPDIAWGTFCVGFAVLPKSVRATSIPASNTSCGVITPPNINCTTYLPNEVNYGQVDIGAVRLEKTITGTTTCSSVATVSATLQKTPYLGGNEISIFINGTQLGSASKVVGRGRDTTHQVTFLVNGTFKQAGEYSDSAVILFSYL